LSALTATPPSAAAGALLRPHAEQVYARELTALIAADDRPR